LVALTTGVRTPVRATDVSASASLPLHHAVALAITAHAPLKIATNKRSPCDSARPQPPTCEKIVKHCDLSMRCGIADEPSTNFRCLKANEGVQQRTACLPARYESFAFNSDDNWTGLIKNRKVTGHSAEYDNSRLRDAAVAVEDQAAKQKALRLLACFCPWRTSPGIGHA
jgi:hypothetical protein